MFRLWHDHLRFAKKSFPVVKVSRNLGSRPSDFHAGSGIDRCEFWCKIWFKAYPSAPKIDPTIKHVLERPGAPPMAQIIMQRQFTSRGRCSSYCIYLASKLCSVLCIASIYCTLYTAQCILYTVCCVAKLCTVYCVLCTVYCVLCVVSCIHCVLQTVYSVPYYLTRGKTCISDVTC